MRGTFIPVCKKCHNYVTGKLEAGHPCPHCGNEDTLSDRSEKEYRSIFSDEIQYDYSQPATSYSPNSVSSDPNTPLRLYTDLPLEFLFPQGIPNSMLPVTEQKVYLQLSLEFRIILDKAPNYQEGMRNWTLILQERLQSYGITRETWDRISSIGDKDQGLQDYLKVLIRKIFQ